MHAELKYIIRGFYCEWILYFIIKYESFHDFMLVEEWASFNFDVIISRSMCFFQHQYFIKKYYYVSMYVDNSRANLNIITDLRPIYFMVSTKILILEAGNICFWVSEW